MAGILKIHELNSIICPTISTISTISTAAKLKKFKQKL